MEFYLHGSHIGNEKHIHYNGKINWTDIIPDNSLSFDELKIALYLSGKPIDIQPPDNWLKSMRSLTLQEKLPWHKIMPHDQYEEFVEKSVNKIQEALKDNHLSYYKNVFNKASHVLDLLKPAKIHKKKFNFLIGKNIAGINESVIRSFEPNEKGYANGVIYDQLSSLSGRFTVKSGPQILLLNKELKSIIRSRHKSGGIYSFDYVSLEPRIALMLSGKVPSYDIYSEINEEIFSGSLTRDAVKLACLSVLYGSGADNLHKGTGISLSECRNIILPQIKKYFDIHNISRKLVNTFKKYGLIWNYFGRAIYPKDGASYKLYNHYIQSTAVDEALLGFYNILINLPELIPLFVIHDNIIFDLENEDLIEKIKEHGSKIYKFENKLPLECCKI